MRQTGSTTILYYHRNQQYSTIALTNTSGEVVERYGYTAYGQMTVMNYLGNVRSWSDWSNRYLYTGREWDDTTKLFHFRARWYEPVAGRFVSRDPLGYTGGESQYAAYFCLTKMDPLGEEVYAIDGTWADESEDAREGIKAGYSAVHQFATETKERADYEGGTGTEWYWSGNFNGATGWSNRGIIRKVYRKICEDFCMKKQKCPPELLEVNLVGWSRGAVAAVEVADWLNYYGCLCRANSNDWFKTRFKPVKVNFVGLFDPVSMHLIDEVMKKSVLTPWAFHFEDTIPSNVRFSAALWRTAELDMIEAYYDGGSLPYTAIFPQLRYRNLTVEHDFYIHDYIPSTHGEAGRHREAFQWMRQKAIEQGVDF